METTIDILEGSSDMIREITVDEVDIIDPIMSKLGQEIDSRVPPNFLEMLKTSIKDGKSFLYGAFTDNNNLNGIGVFGNVSKRISVLYAEGNSDIEKELLDTIFTHHSTDSPFMGAGGPWVTESIGNYLVSLGFRKLDRAYMTLDRNSIEDLETPVQSAEIEYEIFNESHVEELAQLMFKGNDGHIDQIVFPNFFGTINDCRELIKNIMNNVYGEYKEPYSWLLRKNGKLVGACLYTIRNNGDTGYIPDIVVDPEYQGQGLGKAMLIYTMKELLKGEPDIVKVDLDVTLENNARFLYKSIGYENVHESSIYVWLNKSNN